MKRFHRLFHALSLSTAVALGFLTPPAFAQFNCAAPPEGLVGWWKGDGDALDQAGSNDGTVVGDVTYGVGRVGQAFVFDGVGEGITLSNAAELELQDFTIEAWIQRGSTTQASPHFGGGLIFGYGSAGYALGIFDDGNLFLTRVEVDSVAAATQITDTNWHHVAVTKLGTAVAFYVDGQPYAVPPYDTTFTFVSTPAIGVVSGSLQNSFLGTIDEVAIFNRALSASEIQAIFAADAKGKCTDADLCTIPGMVTWWPGEGDGSDRHATHDGELLNGVEFVPGQVGAAFRFDGLDARVRVPASPEVDLWKAPGLTVEGWVWPEQLNPTMVIAEWHDAASGRIGVHLVLNIHWPTEGSPAASVWANLYDGISTQVIASAPDLLAAQQWSHVALTRDAANDVVRLFLNGTIVAEQAMNFSGSTPVTDVDFWLGGRPPESAWGGGFPFEGLLDEVSLYRRALAPAEIQAIYQAGALGKCASPSPRQPLAGWSFDETEGATAWDSIGTRHGTLSAAGAQFTTDGIRGGAIRLTRADSGYVNMGPELVVGNVFTLVAWVKTEPNDTTDTMVVAGKYAAGPANGYYLAVNRSAFMGQPGKALFVASDPDGQELVSTSDVNDGQWHQIVAVYHGGVQKRLYVDGQPAEAVGSANSLIANNAPFLIGGVSVSEVPQGYFQGWIDEVQLHGRALADAEIAYLFQNPDAIEIPELLEPHWVSGLTPQTVERGATVEFSLEVVGQEPFTYAWSKDGTVIEGAEGPLLVLLGVEPTDGGTYTATVSNVWGTISSSAALHVLWPPTIVEAPIGQTLTLGGSATLSVTAEGAMPFSYLWLKNGRPVIGATSRFLLLNNVSATSAGHYQVRVSNADGVALSEPVPVWVTSGVLSALPVPGGLQFNVSGLRPGSSYVLEYTASVPALPNAWEPLVTVVDTGETFEFTDPDPVTTGTRFYRLRLLP